MTPAQQRAIWREKYRLRAERAREEASARYWRKVEAAGRTGRIYQKRDPARHATHCGHCLAPLAVTVKSHQPRKYCGRTCANQAAGQARDRQASTPSRRSRRQRDQQAPGLTVHRRCMLLTRWRHQRRTCAYCPRPATTVDHVVPLIRGGTNWEGNLTPCCRPCNSSKGDQFLTEWRTRRQL